MGRNSQRARQRHTASTRNGRRVKRERVVQAIQEDWERSHREAEARTRNAVTLQRIPDRKVLPGLLAWAWVPYREDPTTGKSRPVLVLQEEGRDVLVAMVGTTRPGDREWERLYLEDWANLGLTRPTGVLRRQVVLPRESLTLAIGTLPPATLQDTILWLGVLKATEHVDT